MAVKFLEPGGSATFDLSLYSSLAGSPSVVSDIVHGQPRSIRCAPSASQAIGAAGVLRGAGSRVSFFLYVVSLPNANLPLAIVYTAGTAAIVYYFYILPSGVLQLYDPAFTQLGSNGATLSIGQWYRITIAHVITSTTVSTIKVFVDGVQSISSVNTGTLGSASPADVRIGNTLTDSKLDIRLSDIYIDDGSGLDDPGDIRVTAKRPVANGAVNGFTTQVGSGGSGYGSGHSPQVNERAASQTNGWSIINAGSVVTEEYTIEDRAIGDVDISRNVLVDFMAWAIAKSLTSETAQLILNGVQTAIALTSTATTFFIGAGSTIYPAGGTAVGMATDSTVTTVTLYECGIVVAYTAPPDFVPDHRYHRPAPLASIVAQ